MSLEGATLDRGRRDMESQEKVYENTGFDHQEDGYKLNLRANGGDII